MQPEISLESICRSEGTIEFEFRSPSLLDSDAGSGSILQKVAGRHVFHLERDKFDLVFTHAAPGTGTRVARLDLSTVGSAPGLHIIMVWAPDETRLVVGPLRPDGELVEAIGMKSDFELIVGRNGQVVQAGGVGVQTGAFTVYENGELVVEPPAIRTWEDTSLAIRTMRQAKSEEGFLFDVVQTNAVIAMLVTGLEAYTQRRFVELAGEGLRPDTDSLAREFPRVDPAAARTAGAGFEHLAAPFAGRQGINFQNYEQMKRGFSAAYGIRFADIPGVSSQDLGELKKAIAHRHHVVHVSPLEAVREGRKTGQLKFSNREYAAESSERIDRFVRAMHKATLHSGQIL